LGTYVEQMRKAIISLVMSVCLSVHFYQRNSH